MKNLIIGAAKGYGWDVIEPFVISWAKNCSDAQLILFVDDISDFTREKLINHGVALENFPEEGVPNNTRWKIFADYLARADCEQVFITDTRDVIFQGNIFAPFKNFSEWLGFAMEGDNFRGDSTGDRTNYEWIADCFGRATADDLLDRKIICDGTVIGSRLEMKIFAENLWKLVAEVQNRVEYRIHDQAVANFMIYNGLLPVKNLFEIDIDGEILTAGLAGHFSICGDKILRGEVPAVVHQYERFEHTAKLADKIYRDRNFRVDKRFSDIRSAIEQSTCLLHADKVDDAAKLFIGKFLATKEFGGLINALLRLWSVAITKNFSKSLRDIEAAIQIALRFVGNFSETILKEICELIEHSGAKNHFVDAEFRLLLINALKNSSTQPEFCAGLLKKILIG